MSNQIGFTTIGGGLRTKNFGDVNALICSNCNSEYLHHQEVRIFERQEGVEGGLRVSVNDLGAYIDNSLTGNPSERRGGIVIQFRCENCGCCSELRIAQHEGLSLVKMVGDDG